MKRFPKIIHRTLPANPKPEVDGLWASVLRHSPGWEHRTYQSPRPSRDWVLTGPLFSYCSDGSMNSNLVRLEALIRWGGIYLDSDVELFRPLDPLVSENLVVAEEGDGWLGTAVLIAPKGHPALYAALDALEEHLRSGKERSTFPRIVTPVLRDRSDVTVLPAKTFYPYTWNEKHLYGKDYSSDPDVYAAHRWHMSWK